MFRHPFGRLTSSGPPRTWKWCSQAWQSPAARGAFKGTAATGRGSVEKEKERICAGELSVQKKKKEEEDLCRRRVCRRRKRVCAGGEGSVQECVQKERGLHAPAVGMDSEAGTSQKSAKHLEFSRGEISSETRVHFKVTRFIMEAGVKLGMQSIPVATACTIYHRFFCETSPAAYDPYLVAMSAIYLAGKVEEQHLRTRDIINVSHRYLHPGSDPLELDSHFWELRDSIVQCELLVLRLLNFHVSFQHPHKYLLHYLVSLKNWMNRHCWDRTPISQVAWALLRDSYHQPVCLRYEAQHIAVAVLYFALQCYGVEVPADAEAEKPWWQVFSDDLTKPVIQSIVSELIHIYTLDTEIS